MVTEEFLNGALAQALTDCNGKAQAPSAGVALGVARYCALISKITGQGRCLL